MPSTERQVIWQAQEGPQSLLVSCPCFEVFYGGARGGGKTDGMLGDWLNHANKYGEHAIGLIIRRELLQLREMIERSKILYGPLGAHWHSQEKIWRFPNNARLNFAHMDNDDDAEKYQGHSYTRVYVEELGNFPSPDPIFKLMATLRSGAGVPVGFRASGNPGGPGHMWVKQRYIDPAPLGGKRLLTEFKNPFNGDITTRDRVFIPARVVDNKYNNTAGYIAQLQMAGGPQLVKAWLFGDWDAIIGAYFDNWNARVHVVRPFALRASWLRFMAADWGSAKPFCFGWYCVVSDAHPIQRIDGTPALIPRGALIKYREYYGSPNHNNVGLKLTVEQVADQIHALESREPQDQDGRSGIKYRVLDPACFNDEGGPTHAERFGNKKLVFQPAKHQRASRGNTTGGWDMLRHRLDGEEGRPMIYFFSTCLDTIRTIPSLQHDKNDPEDVDTEAEDHAGDETRYAVMSRPWIKRDHAQHDPPMTPADEFGNVQIDLDKLFKDNEQNAKRRSIVRTRRL